jgi:hypothetical protein
MSWINNTPNRTAHIAHFACGTSSASFQFSPEDILETTHAELPNIANEATTGSIIEPISLRVSSLVGLTLSGTTKPFIAPGEREKIRLYLALCELS